MASAIPAAVATIAGAGIAAHQNNKASKTQSDAASAALAYQKQKDAQDREDAQKLLAMQQAQFAADQARKAPYRAAAQALLGQNAQRLNLGDLPMWGGAPPSGVMTASSAGPTTPAPAARSLSSLAGMSPSFDPGAVAPSLTLSDVLNGTWNGRG